MALIFSGWNISKWASMSTLKDNTKVVSDLAHGVLSPPAQSDESDNSNEDWDQLMAKLGMNEKQLQVLIKRSRIMVRVYSLLGSLLFSYSFYLFCRPQIMSGILAFIFSILMFAYAFRDHRFIFSCVRKKTKTSIIEWVSWTLDKKSKSS